MTQLEKDQQAFIAVYWGIQAPNFINHIMNRRILELTPLHLITEEDAWDVNEMTKFNHSRGKEFIRNEIRNWLIFNGTGLGNTSHKWDFTRVVDYLRSKGYLLPFRGYTAGQILEMGWAKIKE